MDNDRNIIRYLDGEMQDEERRQFEKEIEKDPALAGLLDEIANLQNLAARALQMEGDPEISLSEDIRREIREMVQEFHKGKQAGDNQQVEEAATAYFKQQASKSHGLQRAWYAIAAVIIAGAIFSIILLQPFTRADPSEIFAEYAGNYTRTEDILEITRADDDFMFALEVFESGDYERSSVLFQMLADSAVAGDYALLYLGHSYMGLSRTDRAITVYLQLVETANGDLLEDTRWYLSLCYLKKEMIEEANTLLEEISISDSPYRSESRKILRSIR